MSLGNALCSINKISQLLNYLVRFPRSMRKGSFGAALLFVFLILFSALTCSDWGLHGTSKISGWLSWAGLLTFLWCGLYTFSLSSLHVINHPTPFFTAPYVWQRPVIVKDGSPATLLLTVKQLSFYSWDYSFFCLYWHVIAVKCKCHTADKAAISTVCWALGGLWAYIPSVSHQSWGWQSNSWKESTGDKTLFCIYFSWSHLTVWRWPEWLTPMLWLPWVCPCSDQ